MDQLHTTAADGVQDGIPGVRSLRGRTPEQAREVGARLFHPHRLTVRSAASGFELAAAASTIGPFTIGTLQYSAPVTVDTGPYESAYQVNVPLQGAFRTSAGGQRLEVTAGRAAVYRPDVATAFSGWDSPCTMLAVKIDRRWFEQTAAAHLGSGFRGPVDFSLGLRVVDGDGAAWLAALRRLTAAARPRAGISALLKERLAEDCALGLLWAGRHSLRGRLEGTAPASAPALRRAIDLIEQAPEEALTLETLALYAGVGGRALQLAFRRELGTTPLQYLKKVRLDRARQALQAAGPAEQSVAGIARRFGFSHLGRFSADYAKQHGQLPSHTLANPAIR